MCLQLLVMDVLLMQSPVLMTIASNIGLIMQNHYVGLYRINIVDDSQSDTPMVVDLPPNTQYSDNPASSSAGIDDQSPNAFD